MSDEVTRFPVSTWERTKNKRGATAVNCFVSGRYLKFHEVGDTGTQDGFVVVADVMTDTDPDEPDRKICELVLPLEELRVALEMVISKSSKP